MEHWHFDTFQTTWRDHRDGKRFVAFDVDPITGAVRTMRTVPEPGEPKEQVPVYQKAK